MRLGFELGVGDGFGAFFDAEDLVGDELLAGFDFGGGRGMAVDELPGEADMWGVAEALPKSIGELV